MSGNQEQSLNLNAIGFIIDERPISVYGIGQKQASLSFMKSFDGRFWEHQLDLVCSVEKENITHEHLTFMRLLLSQAEEHLFALIFAALQAPDSPDLWLYHYRNTELDSLVAKISKGDSILTKHELKESSWKAVTSHLWPGIDEARYSLVGMVLARLAKHFLSSHGRGEYNSLKHAMRLSVGGHAISFAPSTCSESPPEADQFMSLGDSKFGGRFYSFERLEPGHHFASLNFSNWDPEEIGNLLTHAVILIGNMGASFRARNRLGGDREFKFFTGDAAYTQDPRTLKGFIAGAFFTNAKPPQDFRINLEEIRNAYYESNATGDDSSLNENQ